MNKIGLDRIVVGLFENITRTKDIELKKAVYSVQFNKAYKDKACAHTDCDNKKFMDTLDNTMIDLISQFILKLTPEESLDVLKRLTSDNFNEIIGTDSTVEITDSDREVIVGSLLDKFISGMRPEDCTLFFQGLDAGQNPFKVFGFHDSLYNYCSFDAYKNAILLRINDFSTSDAIREYKRYVTPELISQYYEDTSIEKYLEVLKTKDASIIRDYYNSVSSIRYLMLEDDEKANKDTLKEKYNEITNKYPDMKGTISWAPCWSDFEDWIDKNDTSKIKFIQNIIRDEQSNNFGVHRYAILQPDNALLGGISLYDLQDQYKLKVTVWVDASMRKINVAKEAIWVLCNSIKNSNTQYKILEFNINKNNIYMRRVLNRLGADKALDSENNNKMDKYYINIDKTSNLDILNIRT